MRFLDFRLEHEKVYIGKKSKDKAEFRYFISNILNFTTRTVCIYSKCIIGCIFYVKIQAMRLNAATKTPCRWYQEGYLFRSNLNLAFSQINNALKQSHNRQTAGYFLYIKITRSPKIL